MWWRVGDVGYGRDERLDSQVANGIDQAVMAMWQPEVFEAVAMVAAAWVRKVRCVGMPRGVGVSVACIYG